MINLLYKYDKNIKVAIAIITYDIPVTLSSSFVDAAMINMTMKIIKKIQII